MLVKGAPGQQGVCLVSDTLIVRYTSSTGRYWSNCVPSNINNPCHEAQNIVFV